MEMFVSLIPRRGNRVDTSRVTNPDVVTFPPSIKWVLCVSIGPQHGYSRARVRKARCAQLYCVPFSPPSSRQPGTTWGQTRDRTIRAAIVRKNKGKND